MKLTQTSSGTFKLSLKPTKVVKPESTLSEDNDKYLFDQGYTIGFRKDGKLFKFVGLRDGYEKQLELTLSSIIIDNKQYISNDSFVSVNKNNEIVTHNLNSITLENRISSNNFKNMIIVNEKFNNLEIIYEVHIKGMVVKNSSNQKEYIENNNNQFIIGDDFDNNFTIEKPIAYDSNDTKLEILTHHLYFDNDKLYYRKTIINNQIEDNYPIYVDVNISFQPYSFGYINKSIQGDDQETWTDIIDPNIRGTMTSASNTSSVMKIQNIDVGNSLYCSRLYYTFDTSSILNQYIIQKANLIVTSSSATYTFLNKIIIEKSNHTDTINSSNQENNWGSTYNNNESGYFSQNLTLIDNETSTHTLDSDFINAITDLNKLKFSIKGFEYDYEGLLPISNFEVLLSNLTLDIEFTMIDTLEKDFTFPLNYYTNGVGTIEKSGMVWSDTRTYTSAIVINDSNYLSVCSKHIIPDYIVERTFLSFNTSILKYFNIKTTEIYFTSTSSLDLGGSNTLSHLNLVEGLQSDDELDFTDYTKTGSTNLSNIEVISGGGNHYKTVTNINDNINKYGNSKFVIMHPEDFNYNTISVPLDTLSFSIYNEVNKPFDVQDSDFERIIVTLEIEAEAIIVEGNSVYVVTDDPAILIASTTPTNSIAWYEDSLLTQQIDQGIIYVNGQLEIDKSYYRDGDVLYAIAVDDNNEQISINVLSIALSMKEIDGQTSIIIDDSPGLFQLSATTNYSQYQIGWYSDSALSNRLGIGESILLKNDDYNNGDVIFASNINEYLIPLGLALNILINKIKIYGNTLIYFEKYKTFDIQIYSSSQEERYKYLIFYDENLTQLVDSYQLIPTGNLITLKSTLFNDGDKIYVNLFKSFTGDYNSNVNKPLTTISLEISLFEVINNYPGIVSRIDYNDATDLDSVYFKFHNCLNGVCYTYIRDLDNPYEATISVNDVADNGVYNMYSEFDIINEFYSNAHIGEVAYNQNIDLSKKYKEINNTEVYSGSRIILFGQTDQTENGVYQVQTDNSLLKTDELDEDVFRYKISIQAGSSIDDEIHVTGREVSDVFLPTLTFTPTSRYISSPTTEGTPFKIGDWVGGTIHDTIRSISLLTYEIIDQIEVKNDITTFTVNVYDANETTKLAQNSLTLNGNTSITVQNITINVSNWTNIVEGYSCDIGVNINIANILTPGGRFSIYMSWNDNEFINLEYTQDGLFRDDETLISALNGTLTMSIGATTETKTISGIDFYTTNTQWEVNLDQIDNINSRSYPLSQQLDIIDNYFLISEDLSIHGNDEDFVTGTYNTYHNVTNVEYNKLNWVTDIQDSHNWSHISGNTENTYITANVYDWDSVIPDDTINSINYLYIIDTLLNTSDRKIESFIAEDTISYPRLQSDLTTSWVNTASIGVTDSNTGLQLLAGRLVYPQIDFSGYNTNLGIQYDYSSLSGDRYYYRLFKPLSDKFISNGIIYLIDHNITELNLTGNTIKFDISVDSGISWFSLNSQYSGGKLEDGSGCRIDIYEYNLSGITSGVISGSTSGLTISDSAISFTLGYAGSNNYVHLRITISDTVKNKYIGGIQFSSGNWD